MTCVLITSQYNAKASTVCCPTAGMKEKAQMNHGSEGLYNGAQIFIEYNPTNQQMGEFQRPGTGLGRELAT